jgi:hypothetical protein
MRINIITRANNFDEATEYCCCKMFPEIIFVEIVGGENTCSFEHYFT